MTTLNETRDWLITNGHEYKAKSINDFIHNLVMDYIDSLECPYIETYDRDITITMSVPSHYDIFLTVNFHLHTDKDLDYIYVDEVEIYNIDLDIYGSNFNLTKDKAIVERIIEVINSVTV